MSVRRSGVAFGVVAVLAAVVIVRLVRAPTFTDAFYHFNAAVRLAQGDGLTDTYLWTYLGAPERIDGDGTFPSHLYWMPAASLIAGAAMYLAGAPGDHGVAQLPSILMLAVVGCVGFWLGLDLIGTLRAAWLAGLISLFNGFFVRYWGAIETFTPYAFFGSLALLCMGVGIRRLRASKSTAAVWLACGLCCGAAHLTRNDGLLLLPVAFVSVFLAGLRQRFVTAVVPVLLIAAGYGLVMGPWVVRNLHVMGAPLPLGGTQAIWFTEYNELFNFPPDANPERLLAAGIWETRRDAISNNLMTFVAVEGLVVMTPFMLFGLWRRRSHPLIQPFALYALGLHLVMTLVFPFPGYRGGLFHSAAALIPFWAALGVDGLDTAVAWFGRRRRWRIRQAQMIFGAALVGCAAILTFNIAARGIVTANSANSVPALYRALLEALPPGSRILINDPAQLYYFTGFGGAVLPNETPDAIPIIAERYAITHVLIELDDQGQPLTPVPFASVISDIPEFLEPVPFNVDSVRLYAIRAPESTD